MTYTVADKTAKSTLDLADLGLPTAGPVRLTDPVTKARALADIVEHGETRCTEDERFALARALAERLAID